MLAQCDSERLTRRNICGIFEDGLQTKRQRMMHQEHVQLLMARLKEITGREDGFKTPLVRCEHGLIRIWLSMGKSSCLPNGAWKHKDALSGLPGGYGGYFFGGLPSKNYLSPILPRTFPRYISPRVLRRPQGCVSVNLKDIFENLSDQSQANPISDLSGCLGPTAIGLGGGP